MKRAPGGLRAGLQKLFSFFALGFPSPAPLLPGVRMTPLSLAAAREPPVGHTPSITLSLKWIDARMYLRAESPDFGVFPFGENPVSILSSASPPESFRALLEQGGRQALGA